ncbi:DNA (cytosine-5-)-methyltransferase [Alicyclobacillus tolerans]|uniref:Cytosine-specific methyltransferase n=1 Tax=Alicyclobacillus tolerans TaxID=90970 RepID=A0A1M6Y5H8_9BACL|nr:DNA (cytosine-5-)-methyltransferase [Alicyclobacillus montanus]SHL13481.1 DNA (cytosine-5)-methyltransferase 1 [Alicyclobacillus montanus]
MANHVARKVGPMVQRRINALGIGQKMQDLPEELWHESFRYYVKEDPNRRGGPNLRMIRLDPSKPSLTVTGYIFNKFVHPYENRFITVREAARLQGFPDKLVFSGTLTSIQQQVGNAVPVPLAEAVFRSVTEYANQLGFTSPLRAFSLFSGAGGLDIGADLAASGRVSIKTEVTLDSWHDACTTLKGYYGHCATVVESDISKIADPLKLWRDITGGSQRPDLVYGGPPCQAFSQAGKQRGVADPRGELIFEFLRFVEELSPSFFVMENVSNLKGMSRGALYDHIIQRMDEMGYCVSSDVLLAADYGAPQMRRRVIFIGCKKDLGRVCLPTPTHSEVPDLFVSRPYMTVGEAFEGLPSATYSDGSRS